MEVSMTMLFIYVCLNIIGNTMGLWRVFEAAGEKGWKSIIPAYRLFVWAKILNKSWWWAVLALVPYFGWFMMLMMMWKTLRRYNKTRYLQLVPGTFFSFIYLPWLTFDANEKFYTYEELPAAQLGFWNTFPLKKESVTKTKKDAKADTKFVKTTAREWSDAIIFAVVAAWIIRTFLMEFYTIPTSSMESTLMVGDYLAVSKVSYGPKNPQTPIAFPFAHHTLPIVNAKSYVEWLKFPYLRLPGLGEVKRNDVVVFNYPDGDTVILERQNESYYQVVRDAEVEAAAIYGPQYKAGMGREQIWNTYKVVARPVDKRENYIKRCVAVAGDKLFIKDGVLYINDKEAYRPKRMQYQYVVFTDGTDISLKHRKKMNINEEDRFEVKYLVGNYPQPMITLNPEIYINKDLLQKIITELHTNPNIFVYSLSEDMAKQMAALPNVKEVVRLVAEPEVRDAHIFPQAEQYVYSRDNFGPIRIPKAGETVELNDSTLALYKRIIEIYEGNDLKQDAGRILINGVPATQYTFKQNYYWMMGDNRHNSADSRYWGFVPEDHIAGKALFVWLSLDKFKSFGEGKIRFSRMFRAIK